MESRVIGIDLGVTSAWSIGLRGDLRCVSPFRPGPPISSASRRSPTRMMLVLCLFYGWSVAIPERARSMSATSVRAV